MSQMNSPPTKGITVIGDFSSNTSLCKVLNDLTRSLRDANIPNQFCDTTKSIPGEFIINRYTDIVTMFQDYKLTGIPHCRQHRIVFWEFDTGFAQSHCDCIDGNALLTLSKYCEESIRAQVHRNTKVEYIRYPFHFDTPRLVSAPIIRQKFGIPQDAFMVFFNFDYRSSYYRKNPEGLLRAFIEAFADANNAYLVFKTIGSQKKTTLRDRLENFVASSIVSSRVKFINDFITNEELVSLTSACDIYASLHRGEGFGLGIAEAMSMGKAVVASDCGSTNEFCHRDTAEIVPHRMVRIAPEEIDHPAYTWVGEWPEPDVHIAALAMRKLYDDPSYRRALGQRAQTFIRNHYSLESFKKSVSEFFQLQDQN